MSDSNTAVAYFPSSASAEVAIERLKSSGFESSQIGVAASGTPTSTTTDSASYKTGQSAGGAWQKFKSMFSGDEAEPYAGEASGKTFDDNVITPAAYDSEDLHGSLSDLDVPQSQSRYFGHHLGSNSEGVVLTVNALGRKNEALKILEENGGDIGNAASDYEYKESDQTAARNIQLYGEVLRVHKDRVNRGEVRIRKEVHTTTQTIEVPVTHEELVVERVPVTGERPASGATFASEELRIPLSEERASVTKQAVVREEVRVGKKEVSNVEQLSEQVRSEELKVDRDVPTEPVR